MEQPPKSRREKLQEWLPQTRRQRFIFGVAAVFCLAVVLVVMLRIMRSVRSTAPVRDEVITYSVDYPDETEPGDNYAWRGGAEDPKKISIPAIGVDHWIQKVGIDQNQAVAAPNNVHIAGWFTDSVWPGQKGLSIIDGHVSGRSTDGVFKNLPRVKAGDEIVVTMGSGQAYTYKVFDTKTVPNDQAAVVLFEQDPAVTSQLNLITCTGQYDRNAHTYADRVIVYAGLENSR